MITGTDEQLATEPDWSNPSRVTFKRNVPPWNNFTPAGTYTYSFNTDNQPGDGLYTIVTGSRPIYGDTWITANDNSGGSNGFMMIVNCSFQPDRFYEQTISGLCEGSRYEFSVDLMNVDNPNFRTVTNIGGNQAYGPVCDVVADPTCMQKVFSSTFSQVATAGGSRVAPDVEFLIDDAVVATSNPIPNNSNWIRYGVTFVTRPGVTSVKLTMRNKAPGGGGNDLGVDNIAFKPCGPTATISQPSVACNNTVYEANVGSDFPIPAYQWQYSEDGGVTWQNIAGATNQTYTLAAPVEIGNELRFLTAASSTNLAIPQCRVSSLTESANCVLPISLILFRASKEGNSKVRLYWESASEINSKNYVIERLNRNSQFDSIGVVSAKGFSKTRQSYTFLDENPEMSSNFYRLRMVDFDGFTEYSRVQEVKFSTTDLASCELLVYPNPATDKLIHLSVPNELKGQAYYIYDATGKPIKQGSLNAEVIDIDLSNAPNGMYLVRYNCGGVLKTRKFQLR